MLDTHAAATRLIELLDGFRALRIRKWVNIAGLSASVGVCIQELKGAVMNPECTASTDGGRELLCPKRTRSACELSSGKI